MGPLRTTSFRAVPAAPFLVSYFSTVFKPLSRELRFLSKSEASKLFREFAGIPDYERDGYKGFIIRSIKEFRGDADGDDGSLLEEEFDFSESPRPSQARSTIIHTFFARCFKHDHYLHHVITLDHATSSS